MDTGSKPTTDNHAVKKAESINSHYIVISDLARNVKRFYYFFFLFSPPSGNAIKLRICVSRYDSASGDRLLKFLRVLRLLRTLKFLRFPK